MKTRILYFLMLPMLVLISCSDDDDASNRAGELSKVYRDEALRITVNGKEADNKVVEFMTKDLSAADITIRYVVPGESFYTIKGVPLIKAANSSDTYTFSGITVDDDKEIRIEGEIGSKLVLNVSFHIISPAVGKWTFPSMFAGISPLEFEIVPAFDKDSIDMHGILGNQKIPLIGEKGSLQSLIKEMGSLALGLLIAVNLDLHDDGKLAANWNVTGGEPGESPEGLIRYNILNDRIYAAVALEMLFAGDESLRSGDGYDYGALIELVRSVYQGIPLNLLFTGNDQIRLSVDKEMMMPYLDALIEVLKPVLIRLDLGAIGTLLGITGENLALFADEFSAAVKRCDKFEIRFNMKRVQVNAKSSAVSPSEVQEILKSKSVNN